MNFLVVSCLLFGLQPSSRIAYVSCWTFVVVVSLEDLLCCIYGTHVFLHPGLIYFCVSYFNRCLGRLLVLTFALC